MLLIRLLACLLLSIVTACSIPLLDATTPTTHMSTDKAPIHAIKAAIRAPVACNGILSCGDDLSLDKAKDSYSKLGGATSVLKTVIDDHVCGEASTFGHSEDYYWAPMERFTDGNYALTSLRNHAQNGEPFNKWVIVESDKSTELEQHLALCSVSQVKDEFGPPRNCVTVAIITPIETWLRGGGRKENCGERSVSYRNTGGIDIEFDIKTKIDPSKISAELMKMLTAYLDLSSEEKTSRSKNGKLNSIYLKSSGSLRNSKILPLGWREALDFDLYIAPTEDGVSIEGTAHTLVCRQALGNVADYRGLDDSQRAAYAAAFNSGVDSAIRSSCKKYEKRDAKTIICD